MPAAKKDSNGATDTTTPARERFIVSLPQDVGKMIDQVGVRTTAALERETGIAFELSRAQIVQSLVRQALKVDEEVAAAEGE